MLLVDSRMECHHFKMQLIEGIKRLFLFYLNMAQSLQRLVFFFLMIWIFELTVSNCVTEIIEDSK